MTTFEGTGPARPATPSRDAVSGALKEYVRKHPVQAVETAGSQIVLGVRAMQYMFSDIVHRAFPWREFIHQGAFMAGSAVVPTLLVAIPIGVSPCRSSSRCWRGKSVRPPWRARPAVSPSCGRVLRWSPPC
ncbi:Putative YrbE family protein [Mycobacteroides abscessus subsp. abscessus]|nr:Putative YrbE family protein [Mycobacteroides abscessus subsp. abscessus]